MYALHYFIHGAASRQEESGALTGRLSCVPWKPPRQIASSERMPQRTHHPFQKPRSTAQSSVHTNSRPASFRSGLQERAFSASRIWARLSCIQTGSSHSDHAPEMFPFVIHGPVLSSEGIQIHRLIMGDSTRNKGGQDVPGTSFSFTGLPVVMRKSGVFDWPAFLRASETAQTNRLV